MYPEKCMAFSAWNLKWGYSLFSQTLSVSSMTHEKGGLLYQQFHSKPLLCLSLSFTMLDHSGTAIFCNIFGKIGRRTRLNLSPLFDHAVVVQKSPGRFLCVGRDHSHQEADQVISIISLIPHSGTDLFDESWISPIKVIFLIYRSSLKQQNEWNESEIHSVHTWSATNSQALSGY